MRVVIDTNVLISGIFFSGSPSEILKAWRRGEIQFVLSSEIADEYVRVAKILANDFPGIEINSILTLILTNSEIIQAPAIPHQVCEDPDDDMFLACALASECKVIISGDKHLLKLAGYRSIDILTPRMFYVDMYITEVLTKTKKGLVSHRCVLLRESFRKDGKINSRTIANLTHCNPAEVAAMRLALQHKDDLTVLESLKEIDVEQGLSVGAAWLVYQVAREIGIETALGKDRAGKLALWQVMARVINQGSRLSAVRLAQVHAGCDILGLREGFNEDDLYDNLGWLAENQSQIEERLFLKRCSGKKPELFLYDVTSSYFEGECKELSDWGYNRDKKSGKKQVVLGLLCDESGDPLCIQVYRGNTLDFDTFDGQIKKVAAKFGCQRVTLVGDRGMLKSGQITALGEAKFRYITAITKPQIEKLLREGVFQMELFDQPLCEVEQVGIPYVLRRNPERVKEIVDMRQGKKRSIEKLREQANRYLTEHPRARAATQLKKVAMKLEQLKVCGWLRVIAEGKKLELKEDDTALMSFLRLIDHPFSG